MATKKGTKKEAVGEEVNKAQSIRDALEKLGMEATAKQIQEFCAAAGVPDVAPAQISNIRTKLRGGADKSQRVAEGITATSVELLQAKTLAEKLGGVVRAQELLGLLVKLGK